jgi:hypothetical protein
MRPASRASSAPVTTNPGQREQRWCRIHGASAHWHVRACRFCLAGLEGDRCPRCRADYSQPTKWGVAWRCVD